MRGWTPLRRARPAPGQACEVSTPLSVAPWTGTFEFYVTPEGTQRWRSTTTAEDVIALPRDQWRPAS